MKANILSWLICLSVFFFSQFLLAGTHRPDIKDSEFLKYGSRFKCVMPVVANIDKDNENLVGMGSCVVINEHWCITAAHVVQPAFRITVFVNGEKFIIDKAIIHKNFKMEAKIPSDSDIALLYSKKSFGEVYCPELYSQTNERSKICTVAGFGYTGNFIKGIDTKHDFKKRGGTNTVDRIEYGMLSCNASRNGTRLEFLIAEGDSGGGLFINGKLAGIASVIFTLPRRAKGVYGDSAGFTRISSHLEWIEKHVKQ